MLAQKILFEYFIFQTLSLILLYLLHTHNLIMNQKNISPKKVVLRAFIFYKT